MRFAALAVDGLCALAVMAVAGLGAQRATNESSIAPAIVLLTAVAVTLCEVVTDRSAGKWLMGLRIRRPDGSRSGFEMRLARWAMKWSPLLLITASAIYHAADRLFRLGPDTTALKRLDTAATIAGILLFLASAGIFARHRRSLYDLLTGTAVIRADSIEPVTRAAGFQLVAAAVR
jgi:uncharacterized RDD family membrane protein YckC